MTIIRNNHPVPTGYTVSDRRLSMARCTDRAH